MHTKSSNKKHKGRATRAAVLLFSFSQFMTMGCSVSRDMQRLSSTWKERSGFLSIFFRSFLDCC